jgi:hypothetical protein
MREACQPSTDSYCETALPECAPRGWRSPNVNDNGNNPGPPTSRRLAVRLRGSSCHRP